jgi:tRNA pseudouridine38-40 synthase
VTNEAGDRDDEPRTRIRLDIAYDGTDFNGWTRQPGLPTVQGALEDGLATLFRAFPPAPTLVVAGRTDAGVHAQGQVAHVDLDEDQLASILRPRRQRNASPGDTDAAAALRRRLSGVLGPDAGIVVTDARIAPPGFDARFSAIWRRYEYRIADAAAVHDPLQRRRTTWLPADLDAAAMDHAARALVGLHDFAAYCKPRADATTIRTLQEFTWHREGDGVLVARLQADAFCRSMVRALVGGCVAVGEGKLDAGRLVALRDAAKRENAFIVMPARGLTLVEVGYPADAELTARAAQTRARRELHPTGVVG